MRNRNEFCKCKAVPVRIMKALAYGGGGKDIAPLVLNLGPRWGKWLVPRPDRFNRRERVLVFTN